MNIFLLFLILFSFAAKTSFKIQHSLKHIIQSGQEKAKEAHAIQV